MPTPTRRATAALTATLAGALLAGVVLAGVVLAGCGDGGGSAADTEVGRGTTTVTRGTTASSPSSAVPTETRTTAPPSQPTAFTVQARDAVNELAAAWQAGDQARARAIAPGAVVDALFSLDPAGFGVYGCDTGEFDTSTCNLRNRATGAYVTVNAARLPQGWQIATIYVDQG
ncbi:MAG TPA: hypothetical protein VEW93_03225 [Acidimicrobiales bacterium]|nr:hypothetical protein [Acidimicrobiales bacterium]